VDDDLPPGMTALQMLQYAERYFAQMERDYAYYRDLYITFGDEAALAKMIDCVTM